MSGLYPGAELLSKHLTQAQFHAEVSGKYWPAQGPLAAYMEWAMASTDAEPQFHIGAILPVWAHEVTRMGFRESVDPVHDSYWGYRWSTTLVGHAASGKSTAIKLAQKLYAKYAEEIAGAEIDALNTGMAAWVQLEGSIPGLFTSVADRVIEGVSRGIIWHDEVSAFLKQAKLGVGVSEFLCQLGDGTRIERHLKGTKLANRTIKHAEDKIAEVIRQHAYSLLTATTFRGLESATDMQMTEGGYFSRNWWGIGFVGVKHTLRWSGATDMEATVEAWSRWFKWSAAAQITSGREDGLVKVENLPYATEERIMATSLGLLNADPVGPLAALRKRGLNATFVLAQLFALNAQRTQVTEVDLVMADNVVQLSINNYSQITPRLLGDLKTPELYERVRYLVKQAKEQGVRKSSFYKKIKVHARVHLDGVLETLVDAEEIVKRTIRTGRKGRPATIYYATEFAPPKGAVTEPTKEANDGKQQRKQRRQKA